MPARIDACRTAFIDSDVDIIMAGHRAAETSSRRLNDVWLNDSRR